MAPFSPEKRPSPIIVAVLALAVVGMPLLSMAETTHAPQRDRSHPGGTVAAIDHAINWLAVTATVSGADKPSPSPLRNGALRMLLPIEARGIDQCLAVLSAQTARAGHLPSTRDTILLKLRI